MSGGHADILKVDYVVPGRKKKTNSIRKVSQNEQKDLFSTGLWNF